MALWRYRRARMSDLPAIMGVITQAQAFLRAQHVDQWQYGYPNPGAFARDISFEECYVFLEGDTVVGVSTVSFGPEESYRTMEGRWLNPDGPYAVIHRIAVRGDRHGTGLAVEMVRAACRIARRGGAQSIRADTHRDNRPMEKLMNKCGFTPCGQVSYAYTQGDPLRIAYERLLND